MRPNNWYEALYRCETQGLGYAVVTVLTTAGSTPREGGSKMIITGDSQYDTIGGGHLEFQAVEIARNLLAKGEDCQHIESFPLASKLGQCCGGAMKILVEVRTQHTQHLAIFGGGHVAKALVPILSQLPLNIRWIDNREDMWPKDHTQPANVELICDDAPEQEIAKLPAGSWVVIMTHDHQLDFTLVEHSLKHPELSFIGMIGSDTKAKRFQTRLAYKDYSAKQIERLVSPIGDLSVVGKRPIEVAVSISSQLINLLNQQKQQSQPASKKQLQRQDFTLGSVYS